ncbi:hypothetical protein [Fredinandcohnia quinoae]|uniref:Uncharacterized protein n=1 Tax=Fredinandcohnia quinoae TaxID=2918902 RepID=A0AAW5DY15_9BACI|nr:hypothetical protein [Fredinandcohnia sp. SECRCQ15]MCH1623930.1 hypothetical protein [Fredinandcohnia sp. SECRCQ15]
MKSLQDAIYNWLTIKVVADARPDDISAVDTLQLFEDILTKDFQVGDKTIQKDDEMYYVTYSIDGEEKKVRFPIELIDIMHNQIQGNPERYKNYPV